MEDNKEQAEAEVVPSSSLAEIKVEVEVEVGVEVWVGVGVWVKMQFSFLTFSGGWVVGGVVGEVRYKANLNSSCS